MRKLNKVIIFCLLACINLASFAQGMAVSGDEDKGFMYSEGKIYVVVAVIVTIVIGIFIYLVNLDKKIKKLEKQ